MVLTAPTAGNDCFSAKCVRGRDSRLAKLTAIADFRISLFGIRPSSRYKLPGHGVRNVIGHAS